MPLTAKRPTQELIDIVGALGGRWAGYFAMCRGPAHNDSEPSLSIRQGDRGILVTCFAGCDREDVLRKLRQVRTGHHYPLPEPDHARRPSSGEHIWAQAVDVSGTLAERYLARRNLLPAPPDIRFHPRCPYMPKPRSVFLPALRVAIREIRRLVAIQRIFLEPITADYVRKVMLGMPGTGAWRGREGGSTVAIAEGFETADAFTRMNDIPCWASLGARRLHQLVIPSAVTKLLIAEDNDFEGRRAADNAEERYARPGLTTEPAPPPSIFKDWAEALDARGWQSHI